jgi:hypothetical protein
MHRCEWKVGALLFLLVSCKATLPSVHSFGSLGRAPPVNECGNDFIVAGRGADEVFGGPGNDYIVVTDNVYANDTVDCGEGDHDVLVFDEDITGDTWANCELTDGINSDPLAGP